jgi:hypothetical protein
MGDPGHVSVADTRGPVHTGSGLLLNIEHLDHGDPATLLADLLGGRPRTVAEDQLHWLYQRFVHPGGFGEARYRLEQKQTVLLDAPPGAGRSAAANILLYELRNATGMFHELVPDSKTGRLRLEPEIVGEGDRLLLDLSRVGEQLWIQAHDLLPSFRDTVTRRRAHLVVVLPHDRVHRLRSDLRAFLVSIDREPGGRVLRSHLRAAGIDVEESRQPVPALSAYLDRQPAMREIADLADLIDGARRTTPPPGGFPDWCKQALHAVQNRDGEAALLVEQLSEGPQRALLLTTAMLHGARADHVHNATELLLDTVKSPHTDPPLLERADLVQRFREIRATTQPDNTVRFAELGFDAAVRTHFWNHLPYLRPHLRTWMLGAVDSRELPAPVRTALVERFAAQCLHTGPPEDLFTLVERWTATPRPHSAILHAAVETLEHGLRHADHGALFRQKIFDWSRSEGNSNSLTQVLVAVCVTAVAPRHPDQAMVRLHHLARRERRSTGARDTLLDLARADHRLHRLMLARLAHPPIDHYWSTDSTLFLELADPAALTDPATHSRPLLVDPAVQHNLTSGWADTLRRLSHQEWTPLVALWLARASAQPQYADPLMDILVTAATPRADLLGHLYTAARTGTPAAPEQDQHPSPAVTDRLLRKISIAQREHRLAATATATEQGGNAP